VLQLCRSALSRPLHSNTAIAHRWPAKQFTAFADGLGKLPCCLQVPRLVRLLTHIATGLNQHKPEKLHRLFFVDLPAAMRWPLQAARPLLHADIRPKVHVCSLHDSALPFDLEAIPAS